MNILFISLVIIKNLEKRGIYPDLIKFFISKGHHVTILSPIERREKKGQEIIEGEGYTNIRYKTLNNTKTNYVEKLLSTITIDSLMKRAAKKYVKRDIDLLLCATPPVTLNRTIAFVKQKYNAPCYLLLKDIFPDNIADLGLISKKSPMYKVFRNIEKKLYRQADFIGCMSPANIDYIVERNEFAKDKIEVCPNTIWPIDMTVSVSDKQLLREKYKIKEGAKVFFYGGNLGLPQMISFLVEVLDANKNNEKAHFIIVGAGTDFKKLKNWHEANNPSNTTLLSFIPKKEYDQLIKVGDVGLIFLDNRYKIPNYPNRILAYMENKMPSLIATDVNTDIGKIAEENGYGKWCESGNLKAANDLIDYFSNLDEATFLKMGEDGHQYLIDNYTVQHSYDIIMKHFPQVKS